MNTFDQHFTSAQEKEAFRLKGYFKFKSDYTGYSYNVELMPDAYSRYDARVFRSDGRCAAYEVKVRDQYTYDQIEKWGGSYLEYDKVQGIIDQQISERIDIPIYYINFYSDRVVIYHINKEVENYKWEKKWLQESGFNKQKVEKCVTRLSKDSIVETYLIIQQ